MRGQYKYEAENIQIWGYLLFYGSRNVKKHLKKHIQKTAKSKPTSNKLKEEICFILRMYYSLEHERVDK